ncbi:flagellar protein FlgA [Isoptericola hypogeus]|uniref:Flagellar protein FlgA n=1 Tax=Isoptericola hypogeus TaxID=300179 RepID=A0ABN2IQT4_9MICO
MPADHLPAPAAPRLRRPTWRDPRLVVGVVIVAASVALGSWAVSSAGQTVPVYAADGTLTPGEPVDPDRLRTVDVRLGSGADLYLRADEPLPADLVALRVVDEGELVARTALGAGEDVDVRSVAVPVERGVSERIRAGAVVDLWSVPEPEAGAAAAGEPTPLVSGVVVEQVDASDAGLVVADGATLHVLVPADELPAVLRALGSRASVTVVPQAGAGV